MRLVPWMFFLAAWLGGCAPAPDEPLARGEQAIIGGAPASSLEFPGVVAVLTDRLCTGTLIHPRWVLTAAHCVADRAPDEVEVRVGASDLSDASSPDVYSVVVRSVIVHPGYQDVAWPHDSALLQLAEAIEDRPTIAIQRERVGEGALVTQVGYGVFDQPTAQGTTGVLHRVEQTIASCQIAGQAGLSDLFSVCFDSTVGRSACFGDSGGPALATFGGELRVVGIVSGGTRADCTEGVEVYTRMAAEADFIDAHVPAPAAGDLHPRSNSLDGADGEVTPTMGCSGAGRAGGAAPLLALAMLGGLLGRRSRRAGMSGFQACAALARSPAESRAGRRPAGRRPPREGLSLRRGGPATRLLDLRR